MPVKLKQLAIHLIRILLDRFVTHILVVGGSIVIGTWLRKTKRHSVKVEIIDISKLGCVHLNGLRVVIADSQCAVLPVEEFSPPVGGTLQQVIERLVILYQIRELMFLLIFIIIAV